MGAAVDVGIAVGCALLVVETGIATGFGLLAACEAVVVVVDVVATGFVAGAAEVVLTAGTVVVVFAVGVAVVLLAGGGVDFLVTGWVVVCAAAELPISRANVPMVIVTSKPRSMRCAIIVRSSMNSLVFISSPDVTKSALTDAFQLVGLVLDFCSR